MISAFTLPSELHAKLLLSFREPLVVTVKYGEGMHHESFFFFLNVQITHLCMYKWLLLIQVPFLDANAHSCYCLFSHVSYFIHSYNTLRPVLLSLPSMEGELHQNLQPPFVFMAEIRYTFPNSLPTLGLIGLL